MAEDYYALLGVRRDASQDEIKRAYRRLARELHPDVNPDPETQEKFKEINQAYEVLQDTDKRQMYDMGGDPFATAGAGAGGFGGFGAAGFPFSEFVDAVFGATGQASRGPRSRARRGRNATIRIELDLSECAFGATRELTVDTAVVCPTCSGEGTAPGTHPATCEVCQGRGEISQVRRSFLGQVVTSQPCPNCGGYGTVLPRPCPECDGDGRVRSRRTMKVRIPAGVEDGTHIQLAGEGETGPGGGPPGDLFLEVVQKPHAIFERQGDDLHCTLTIPMVAAALGATVSVESLDGPNDVDVRPGTQSGQVLPLYGLGVKHLNGSGRGDLIIHVTVETPSRLDPEQEKLLRDLAKLRGEEAPPGKFQPGQQGFFSRLRDAFNGRLEELSHSPAGRATRHQRAVRESRVAAATAPAVDVRSTVGPSRASIAPASRRAARSAGLMPPSGPTISITSPSAGRVSPCSLSAASASRTIAQAAAEARFATAAVLAGPAMSGSQARRDCLAASRAVARHLPRARSPRSPCQRVTERSADHGSTASTPTSVISSTASSPRSPFGSAWATTRRGCGGGTARVTRISIVTESLPTAVTTPSASVPAPSLTSARSPARRRRTAAA